MVVAGNGPAHARARQPVGRRRDAPALASVPHGVPRRRIRRRAASMTTWPSACPPGISVPFAEKSLTEAGRELGLEFHFEKLGPLAEHLRGASAGAARGQRRPPGECGRGDLPRLFRTRRRHRRRRPCWRSIGAEAGLEREDAAGLSARRARATPRSPAARSACAASACAPCPTCCSAAACWCPGTVNVATYVHALDQALFPVERRQTTKEKPTLH